MKRLVRPGLAITLAAAATVYLGAPVIAEPAAGEARSSIAFGACPADLATPYPQLTCANVQVPIDYSNPGLGTTTLLLSKSAARNPSARRGTLIVNPGGPGAGGAEYVGRLSKPDASGTTRLPAEVLDSYDVIGLDPRGVAHSSPISCVDPSFWAGPQPAPDVAANRIALWQTWSTFADSCRDNAGPLLGHIGTKNVARDIDRIRENLGESKISYLGWSYGTYLGTAYATMFPNRVDRMVLDSNVDPTPEKMWFEATLTQNEGVQRRLGEWFAWIAKYDNVYHLGTDAEQIRSAWNAMLDSFRATPHGQVGAHELQGLFYGAMFAEILWEPLAQGLSDYVRNGDDTILVQFASPAIDPAAEESTAAFNAVICRDAEWPVETIDYERAVSRSAQTSQFAWYNGWTSGAACLAWSVASEDRVLPTGQGLPPILMFNSVGDPATPYAGAQQLHQLLPSSVLVTEQNSGKHGVFAGPLSGNNPAANQIGADYLVRGILPSQDIDIPGHALPVPTGATTTTAVTDLLPAAATRTARSPIPPVE